MSVRLAEAGPTGGGHMQNLYEQRQHLTFPTSKNTKHATPPIAEHTLLPPPMSGGKKRYTLSSVSINLGCGSSCRRPKLSAIFHPKPRHAQRRPKPKSSASSWDTTTTFSSASDTESDIKSLRAVQGFGRVGGSSVAVEKDSDDPYLDFRQSMLQMILEKEIYGKDDLKELLNCFLQLNSPYYHGIIVRAFTEIWNGVYSNPPESSNYY